MLRDNKIVESKVKTRSFQRLLSVTELFHANLPLLCVLLNFSALFSALKIFLLGMIILGKLKKKSKRPIMDRHPFFLLEGVIVFMHAILLIESISATFIIAFRPIFSAS